MTGENTDQPFSPLVGAVITTMFEQSAATTNRLIESLQYQLAHEQARNDAIVWKISQLCDGPHVPNPALIRSALYPSDELIARFKKEAER